MYVLGEEEFVLLEQLLAQKVLDSLDLYLEQSWEKDHEQC